jgi:hypothetical protein
MFSLRYRYEIEQQAASSTASASSSLHQVMHDAPSHPPQHTRSNGHSRTPSYRRAQKTAPAHTCVMEKVKAV